MRQTAGGCPKGKRSAVNPDGRVGRAGRRGAGRRFGKIIGGKMISEVRRDGTAGRGGPVLRYPFFAKASFFALPVLRSTSYEGPAELRRTGLRACELRRARWNLGGADFGWGGVPGDVREKWLVWVEWPWCVVGCFFAGRRF